MGSRFFALAAALAFTTLAAHAGTYQYTVVINNAYITGTATFTSPTFITTETTVTATGTTSVGPVATVQVFPYGDCTSYSTCYYIYAANGASTALAFNYKINGAGTYNDTFGAGYLTITDLPSAATPEPSSLMLLGTGLAGLSGLWSRRRRSGSIQQDV